MVLWDCASTLELDEEQSTEEIQLSAVNITTRRKGIIMAEILLLPNIRKIQEIHQRKHSSNNQTPPKYDLVITKEKFIVVSKPVKDVESKIESKKKSLVEHDMGCDILEDINKTKANISLFEMCNLPQHRKKLQKA